ncbi:lymphocyte antigen 75 [Pantherophis guttatus]|uniref:Lymphocyte antigen 75 n=1 Tax=Pantherophis guttatus TaxID=94885 RepID=A0ABM3Z6H4_PANGU|nr:lymphocyte antigen 75 [Pantherophis guttatus]
MRGLLLGSVSTCRVILTVAVLCCCCANRAASSDNNLFTIRHEKSNKCIQVKSQRLILGDCKEADESLWTWVSQHRLFNLGSQKCLGLETVKSTNTLKMFACDSDLNLWWRCVGDSILSTSQNKLALKNELLTVSLNSSDVWRRSNSRDTICKFPYSESYTRDGNAYGKPCAFPYLLNNTWYHDCIHNEKYAGGKWCSTTTYFNQDGQWGFCLKREDGCQNTWEQFKDSGNCYQLNTQAALSWKAAYLSCKKQGSDLVSITSASELNYIRAKDGIAEIFWIGLNQLDVSGGWQWSDHTPLNFVNWNSEMQDITPLEGNDCAAMNADTGDWKSYPCDTPLPYVCKKQVNDSQPDFPDIQNNVETQCESGWYANNGFCYMLKNNMASWNDSYQLCNELNSSLISLHSLADVELVITKLHNDTKDKIWIGLINKDIPALFKWSDDSKVVFTYWDQNEPKVSFKGLPNCVSYSGKFGRWNILPCNNKLKSVCMKKGKVLEEQKYDKGCSPSQEWKKHGDYCYRIDKNEVVFGSVCNLTIANRFEQEFINNLIRMHNKVEEKYFWTGLQGISSSGEYRWGSVDGNNELLTYTNWGFFQPEFRGGCVAMSSGRYIGKWEVKDCQTFKAYSICKKYIGPKRETEIMPKITDPCPEGWSNGSGLACYKFFHKERMLRTRTWEEAERFCEALGGHLPSFSNSEEIKELHTILRKIISDDRWVWIGLNKRNPELLGSWQWSDDKPVSTVVMPLEFREDDYDIRDCAAIKTLGLKRRPWWHFYLYEAREEEFYLKPFHCDAKLEWVCQITKGSTPKTPEWYKPDEEGIHGPTVNIDGSEFWFVPNKHLTYQEASLYCSENESDLAYVTTFTALNGILNTILKLSDENQNWWFKYKIPITHYRLRFFSRYFEYHPRKCWHISYQSWSRGSSLDCSTKLPFICEKYNASLLETTEPGYKPPQKSCPENWIFALNKCYRKVTPQNMTFNKADEYCQSLGGFLPSIKSQIEQDFITTLLPSLPPKIWIGLRSQVHMHVSKWTDGSDLDYINFHPLLQGRLRKIQFDVFNEEESNQCGILLNNPKAHVGTWNFTSCANTLPLAICQKHPDPVENQTIHVPELTMKYLNVTYTLILKKLTWFDAQEECLQNNMRLVSITEPYQQAFLGSQVALHNNQLWIGLSSYDDGEHYHWTDKKYISFSRWSEEDKDLVDDCVYLDTDGFWKTSECNTEKTGAICYLPRNDTETQEAYHESIKCPHKIKNTPWIAYRNSCYTFLIPQDRWEGLKAVQANHLCMKMNSNASLLNIRDEDENDFILEQFQSFSGLVQWMWLGLVYDTDVNRLKWYDDTYVSYNNWRNGRPNIRSNFFLAGVNLDGFWDIYDHSRNNWLYWQFGFHTILVCKLDLEPKISQPPLPKQLPYKNNVYWILRKQLNWYDAWKECKQKGSDLASIHSTSEHVFLEDIVKRDGFPLWIGLSNHKGNDSDFEWSDGSRFDYQPWEYQHSHSFGNCFAMDTKGIWNRRKCTSQGDGAICYSSSKKVQLKQTETSSKCPDSPNGASQWLFYKDYCYAFDMAFYNYSTYTADTAKKVCKKLDPSADLLTIKDGEENKFVSAHLKEYNFITGKVWLGMQFNANSLNWFDGSEAKYTNWANETEKANGQCSVIFSANGTWSKADCNNEPSRVVCKTPQVSRHSRGAIAVCVTIVIALLIGLAYFLYRKMQLHSSGLTSVRYERGMHDDETDTMFSRNDD